MEEHKNNSSNKVQDFLCKMFPRLGVGLVGGSIIAQDESGIVLRGLYAPLLMGGYVGMQLNEMVRSKNIGGTIGTVVGVGFELGKDLLNGGITPETFFRAGLTGALFRVAGELIERGIRDHSTLRTAGAAAGLGGLFGFTLSSIITPDVNVGESAKVAAFCAGISGILASDFREGKIKEAFGTLAGALLPLGGALIKKDIGPDTYLDGLTSATFARTILPTIFGSRRFGEIDLTSVKEKLKGKLIIKSKKMIFLN